MLRGEHTFRFFALTTQSSERALVIHNIDAMLLLELVDEVLHNGLDHMEHKYHNSTMVPMRCKYMCSKYMRNKYEAVAFLYFKTTWVCIKV